MARVALFVLAALLVTASSAPALSTIGQACRLDAHCALLFRGPHGEMEIQRALDFVSALQRTNRTLPYWPPAWHAALVESLASVGTADVPSAASALPPAWANMLNYLVRYKLMAGNPTGCPIGMRLEYDPKTAQMDCFPMPGVSISDVMAADETSTGPWTAAVVLFSVGLAIALLAVVVATVGVTKAWNEFATAKHER